MKSKQPFLQIIEASHPIAPVAAPDSREGRGWGAAKEGEDWA